MAERKGDNGKEEVEKRCCEGRESAAKKNPSVCRFDKDRKCVLFSTLTEIKAGMGRDSKWRGSVAPSGLHARTVCRWFPVSNRFLLACREDFIDIMEMRQLENCITEQTE